MSNEIDEWMETLGVDLRALLPLGSLGSLRRGSPSGTVCANMFMTVDVRRCHTDGRRARLLCMKEAIGEDVCVKQQHNRLHNYI